LLLTHEEGKNLEMGSGTEPVSKEEGQGDKQTGGIADELCLEQNKDNISEAGSKTVLQTGASTSSKIRAKQLQNVVP